MGPRFASGRPFSRTLRPVDLIFVLDARRERSLLFLLSKAGADLTQSLRKYLQELYAVPQDRGRLVDRASEKDSG
jgi:hypothetical protein